jgi:hypothetical protein
VKVGSIFVKFKPEEKGFIVLLVAAKRRGYPPR